jgi:hypothetical protein
MRDAAAGASGASIGGRISGSGSRIGRVVVDPGDDKLIIDRDAWLYMAGRTGGGRRCCVGVTGVAIAVIESGSDGASSSESQVSVDGVSAPDEVSPIARRANGEAIGTKGETGD